LSDETPSRRRAEGVLALQLLGVLLFLFIPVVLFLFVKHPRPIGWSVGAGVALMLGHRFLARPYMQAVRDRKCLWCNGAPIEPTPLALPTSDGAVESTTCARHREPATRFFRFLGRSGAVLRVGIFLPLLLLLAALVAAALGQERWLAVAVPLFQLLVGISVNVAALGYLLAPASPLSDGGAAALPRVPFPVHNFFLLGVRNLLWILRLVGLWWIVRGVLGLLRLL